MILNRVLFKPRTGGCYLWIEEWLDKDGLLKRAIRPIFFIMEFCVKIERAIRKIVEFYPRFSLDFALIHQIKK